MTTGHVFVREPVNQVPYSLRHDVFIQQQYSSKIIGGKRQIGLVPQHSGSTAFELHGHNLQQTNKSYAQNGEHKKESQQDHASFAVFPPLFYPPISRNIESDPSPLSPLLVFLLSVYQVQDLPTLAKAGRRLSHINTTENKLGTLFVTY